MRHLLEEYGRFILALIAGLFFFGVVGILMGDGEHGIRTIFEKERTKSEALTSTENGQDTFADVTGDVSDKGLSVPYFIISENLVTSFSTSAFTYDDALKQVSPMYKENKLGPDNVKIIVYMYEPVVEKKEGDINGQVVMETVNAVDKYGKYVYEEDGITIKKVTQVKYKESKPVELKPGTYIDTSADAAKIKLIYRASVGTLKSETEVTYTKSKTTRTVSPSGVALTIVYED